ncbi:hypothetical protein BGX27_010108 [Mortierella sp. AM989]|nr:hypothetical protein BGX27_010108 [Mortierella sp. AM989]
MGQSFNFQGIIQSFRVLVSPKLMVPNLIVRDIRDINFEQLHKSGIAAIAFDKDNCLTRPYGNDLYPPFKDAWKSCREVYKDQVVIVSNSAGTNDDKDHQQAKAIEKALQVPVLRHEQKKPSGGDELLKHFSGIKSARIAFVGDRALTDVVFGNNYGMLTILTRDIISEEGDNPMAIRIRKMEHRVLAFLDRMNVRQDMHPIPIDLHAVVMQQPPPPETKEQAKAQAAIDKARAVEAAKEIIKEKQEPSTGQAAAGKVVVGEKSCYLNMSSVNDSTNSNQDAQRLATESNSGATNVQENSNATTTCAAATTTTHTARQEELPVTGAELEHTDEPVHSIQLIGHIKGVPGRPHG